MRCFAFLLIGCLTACGGRIERSTNEGSGGSGGHSGQNDAGAKNGNGAPVSSQVHSVELIAGDPLRRTYDFERMEFGHIVQNGEIMNAGSHIDYHHYYASELTVGVQGGEKGIIVDLGHDDDVAARIGVAQTVGGGQGFAGLALGKYGFNDPAAAPVLTTPAEALSMQGTGHARPELGHVLALRIVRPDQVDLIVKLMIVDVVEGERVSFLWSRLH